MMISRCAVVASGCGLENGRCFEPDVAAVMVPLHSKNPPAPDIGFVQCPEAHQNHVPGVGSFGLDFQDFNDPVEQGLEDGQNLDFDASECWLA